MQYQKIFSIVIGILFFGTAMVLWARSEPDPPVASVNHLTTVRVGTVDESIFQRTVKFSGITRAAQRANLSFAVAGRIAEKNVEIGQIVSAGDVILQLDDQQFKNTLESAKAKLAELKVRISQAERDRRRIDQLLAGKAATSEQQEQISATYNALLAQEAAAIAQVAEARRQLGETVLHAPFNGNITSVLMEPGEWTAPGLPAAEIVGFNNFELSVEVPETIVSKIGVGQPVEVELPFSGHARVEGKIVSVSAAASGSGRLFPVLVRLAKQSGLSAGMTAELIIKTAAEKKLNVPLKAVINPGASRPSLFRVKGDKAERVPLSLGQIMDDRVAVKGSLRVGDKVVIAGHTSLADGDHVEVRQ